MTDKILLIVMIAAYLVVMAFAIEPGPYQMAAFTLFTVPAFLIAAVLLLFRITRQLRDRDVL